MAKKVREIAERAFSSSDWCSAVDALFQATGINVGVMDFQVCDVLSGGQRCSYCYYSADIASPSPLSCYDNPPKADADAGRIVCRAGLAVLYAPVTLGDEVAAHLTMSGFVTSTRERRGLYEHILARGVPEDLARRTVKALPVIPRRQVDSHLQMMTSIARIVLEATAERMSAADRVEELRLFMSAGHQMVSTERLDSDSLGGVIEEAVAIVGAEEGAILRVKGSALEVTSHSDGWRAPAGSLVSRAGTAAGRAADTLRTIVAPARTGASATLAMPLKLGERLLGVLEMRLKADALPLSQDRVGRLNRFAQFIAIALEREDERSAVERAMSGYSQLNDLATSLGGQTDVNGVIRLISNAVERSFDFDLAGVVLTGWGRDIARVIECDGLEHGELESVLGEISGRDLATHPFERLDLSSRKRGAACFSEPPRDWSLLSVALQHGDLDIGWLFIARGDALHYTAQDHALLNGIGAHAAAAFGRSALFERVRDDYAKTIAALSATLDIGERTAMGHSGRVMDYAVMIGEELDLPYEEVEKLRFAGLLHDIGKTGVSDEILLKPTKLTPEEAEQVKRHAEIGASIVDQIDFLKSLSPVILHHHEHWDGKGYPAGLKGEAIPLLARVLSVADAFDAMTSERAYAKRLTVQQARTELEKATGTQFDPRVVAALLEALDRMAVAGATGLFVGTSRPAVSDLPA